MHLHCTVYSFSMDYIQGTTKSPSRVIYKDFQNNWREIQEGAKNLDQLLFFNYDRDEFKVGTTFHTRVIDTKNFCETAWKRDCFQRGDYKALCELLVIYLGGHVPGFQFKQPGAHHHARFMADCLYLLTMQLTSKINSKLNKSEKDMLQMSTDFNVIFYGSYFLKSPIAA